MQHQLQTLTARLGAMVVEMNIGRPETALGRAQPDQAANSGKHGVPTLARLLRRLRKPIRPSLLKPPIPADKPAALFVLPPPISTDPVAAILRQHALQIDPLLGQNFLKSQQLNLLVPQKTTHLWSAKLPGIGPVGGIGVADIETEHGKIQR